MTITTIGPHRLILGNAYTVLPTLGWFDALCMDPPYLFNNSGGGAYRAARGASDQIVAEGWIRALTRPSSTQPNAAPSWCFVTTISLAT
jgi:hypothetical protein